MCLRVKPMVELQKAQTEKIARLEAELADARRVVERLEREKGSRR